MVTLRRSARPRVNESKLIHVLFLSIFSLLVYFYYQIDDDQAGKNDSFMSKQSAGMPPSSALDHSKKGPSTKTKSSNAEKSDSKLVGELPKTTLNADSLLQSRLKKQNAKDDSDCPFRDSPIYRKVYVYPNIGDVQNGWHGGILSDEGKQGLIEEWPWLKWDRQSRLNATSHYDINDQHVQYATEILVRELLINPKSCLRTYDPEEATLFWVPYMPSIEHHQGNKYIADKKTSPYGTAIRKIIEDGDYMDWEKLFGLTSKYWRRRNGTDHILVFSEPLHGLWHPNSRRGNFHFVNTQKQLAQPIVISVELSTSFVKEYPHCAAKNILVPYPNSNGMWFNGKFEQEAWDMVRVHNLTVSNSAAAFPNEKRLSAEHRPRPIGQFYGAGSHGTCRTLRNQMASEYKACSKSPAVLKELSAGMYAHGMRISTFCPCPGGDSPSAKRMFDAILAGCIPVVLSADFVWPFTSEFDESIDLDSASFSIRYDAGYHSKELLDRMTCRDLNASEPSLETKLASIPVEQLAKLRLGVDKMRDMYSWYKFRPDLPDNPLREGVLPDGGLSHRLVQALAERAGGVKWPSCAEERQKPHGPHPSKFLC